MARIRSIKPEFWSSEQIMDLSRNARLAFIGLWNFCDDGGNHPASQRTLKAEIFPGDDLTADEVRGLIDEMLSAGLLKTYEVDGKAYWHVTGWHHQRIERPTIKHPEFKDDSASDHGAITEHSTPEWKGEEGKGKDKENTPQPPADRGEGELPQGFVAFWNAWPTTDRKQARGKCAQAWKKAGAERHAAEVVAHVEAMKASEAWRKDGGQFIPQPLTYLNQRRWEGAQTGDVASAQPAIGSFV